MSNSTAIIRALIIFGIVIPLAILLGCVLGYLKPGDNALENIQILSDPRDPKVITLVLVLLVLLLPLFLKWHHQLLYLSWNSAAVAFFLPGRPEFWMFMAAASFIIFLVQKALAPELLLKPVRFVLAPLLFIFAVVVVTAILVDHGIHLGTLGAKSLGGRKYLLMIAGVLGFVALSSYHVPEKKTRFFIGAYFLSPLTEACGTVVNATSRFIGAWLSFILILFPPKEGSSFLYGDTSAFDTSSIYRDHGLTVSCEGIVFYLLARYGLRELLSRGWLRKIIFLCAVVGCLLGGFRSLLLKLALVGFFLFWLEGLFRSKFILLPIMGVLLFLPLLPFADKLPTGIQRTLSVVPIINVSPDVRANAETSSDWRVRMWQKLLPEIWPNFWLGKGFETSTADYLNVINSGPSGADNDSESFIMVGDYHNGPLSVLIPFGIWGAIGWLWFLGAAYRALQLNYRYGEARLKTVNTFLLALFLTRTVFFFFVFGAFQDDVAMFAGQVALSIALNGGVKRAAPNRPRVAKPVDQKFNYPVRFAPGILR